MHRIRKWAAACLTAAATLGATVLPTAAATFEDMDAYGWAAEAVSTLAEQGIVSGVDATHFAPQEQIRRADFIVMLVRAFGIPTVDARPFADVTAAPYYYGASLAAKERGFVSGDAEGRLRPEEPVTRQDMFTMAYRAILQDDAFSLRETGQIEPYVDLSEAADYARPAMISLALNGLVSGAEGRIRPNGYATRAETAQFLYRVFQMRTNASAASATGA